MIERGQTPGKHTTTMEKWKLPLKAVVIVRIAYFPYLETIMNDIKYQLLIVFQLA
jgi:hypothetical protein